MYDSLPIYIISFYIMYACVILYFAGNLLDCYQHYCTLGRALTGLLLIVMTLWLTTMTHSNIIYPIQYPPYLAGLADNTTYPYPHNNSSTQQVDRSLNMNNNIRQQGATHKEGLHTTIETHHAPPVPPTIVFISISMSLLPQDVLRGLLHTSYRCIGQHQPSLSTHVLRHPMRDKLICQH